MTKKKTPKADPKTEPKPSAKPTTVIGAKRIRKNYTLGDDYQAWKEHCDALKTKAAFHSAEATRYRNAHKKAYENGAAGFCSDRDEREWNRANNLITIAELKDNERANAWKVLTLDKLDLPPALLETLKSHFANLNVLCEWIGKDFRAKKKGIGKGSIDKIRDALNAVIAPYHEPIIQAELEQAKTLLSELSK